MVISLRYPRCPSAIGGMGKLVLQALMYIIARKFSKNEGKCTFKTFLYDELFPTYKGKKKKLSNFRG